jgi:hypothetical protein
VWVGVELIIADSARKHGVSDDDTRHACAHTIRVFELDEGLTMIVDANRAAIILETGVVNGALAPVVVHAMKARDRFLG